MTSPSWFTAPAAVAGYVTLACPAGCVEIPGPRTPDRDAPGSPPFWPRRPVPPAPRTWRRARETIPLDLIIVLVSAAVAALALLSGGPDQWPTLTARSSPLDTPALTPTAEAQVIAAYTAYFPALTAAEPQPQPQAATMLAPYAGQPYLGHVLAQMAWYRAHDEVSWGYLVPHVTSVQITGGQAVVRDCQNASNGWLVSTVTGRVIPGTVGSARTNLIAILVRGGDGRWRLTLLAHLAGPCSPVPSPS